MNINSPTLFIEINNYQFNFVVSDVDENNNFRIILKDQTPIQGIEGKMITDFKLVHQAIKKGVYLIEQKLNFTFKDVILILDNFIPSFINLTGYKKLNGSQILKENITFILNSAKSNIDEFENQKKILHIFNSKYCLDKKKVENLPLGLYGNLYTHELSFCLINNNNYKNIINIFDKLNLKVRKILLKSFIEGANLSINNKDIETFFHVEINENKSKFFYFENDALKFEQNYDFGSDLILNDISKITSLKKEIVKDFLSNSTINHITTDQECIEKEFFVNENYRKIKKKLIFDIASARIKELSEVIVLKNVNSRSYLNKKFTIFIKIDGRNKFECFKESYRYHFSKNHYYTVKFIDNIKTEQFISRANNLVHFGWKKEVIPVVNNKKSIIARFFDVIFG